MHKQQRELGIMNVEKEVLVENAEEPVSVKSLSSASLYYQKALDIVRGPQMLAHTMLLGTLIIFAGFCIIVPQSIQVLSPLVYSCLRLGLMTVTTFPLALIIDWKSHFRPIADNKLKTVLVAKLPGRREIPIIIVAGLAVYGSSSLFQASYLFASPTIANLIQPTTPVFACLLAVALRKEGRSLIKFLGVFLSVLGAVSILLIISFLGDKQSGTTAAQFSTYSSLIGCLFMLGNCIIWAVYLVTQKVLLDRGHQPLTIVSWSILVAFICSCFLAPFSWSRIQWTLIDRYTVIGLFFGSLAHGTLNYALTNYASRNAGPTVISVYQCMLPLVSAITMFVFKGERLNWMVSIGAVIIIAGLLLVAIGKKRE